MSRRSNLIVAFAGLLTGGAAGTYRALTSPLNDEQLSQSIGPAADLRREVVVRLRSGQSFSRSSRYDFLQTTPDLVNHCNRMQVVCRGTFTPTDFREEHGSLLVLAPAGCRAIMPGNGIANRVWVIWLKTGQEYVAKNVHLFPPDLDPAWVEGMNQWPMCPVTDGGAHHN